MRRVMVFNFVSLDGYFVDAHGDMSWAHADDPESRAFAAENASGGGEGEFLFGRVTYDLMARYWPTPLARQNDPVVAEAMNARPKIVFSRTLEHPSWANTRVVKGDVAAEVRKMKSQPGGDMVIFGSGTIISPLAQVGLIDEYQLVVNPIVLGAGRSMFEGVKEKLALRLIRSRVFGNGNVFLCYEPAA